MHVNLSPLLAAQTDAGGGNGFIGLLVLAGIIALLSRLLKSKGSGSKKRRNTAEPSRIELRRNVAEGLQLTPEDLEPATFPYKARPFLLSKAERSFYEVLRRVVGDEHCVFAKVRLADLLTVPKGAPDWQAHFNRIQAKHLDFIVCDMRYLRPRVALELDDSSHAAPSRQERDHFVNRAVAAAGLSLVRIPARDAYSMSELRQALSVYLIDQTNRHVAASGEPICALAS